MRWRLACEHSRIEVPGSCAEWRCSFLRRLHGESLIGDFWQLMNSAYLQRSEEPNALDSMSLWVGRLLDYWDLGASPELGTWSVYDALRWCPILRPFVEPTDVPSPIWTFVWLPRSEDCIKALSGLATLVGKGWGMAGDGSGRDPAVPAGEAQPVGAS